MSTASTAASCSAHAPAGGARITRPRGLHLPGRAQASGNEATRSRDVVVRRGLEHEARIFTGRSPVATQGRVELRMLNGRLLPESRRSRVVKQFKQAEHLLYILVGSTSPWPGSASSARSLRGLP
jgi:hypothetical protein